MINRAPAGTKGSEMPQRKGMRGEGGRREGPGQGKGTAGELPALTPRWGGFEPKAPELVAPISVSCRLCRESLPVQPQNWDENQRELSSSCSQLLQELPIALGMAPLSLGSLLAAAAPAGTGGCEGPAQPCLSQGTALTHHSCFPLLSPSEKWNFCIAGT